MDIIDEFVSEQPVAAKFAPKAHAKPAHKAKVKQPKVTFSSEGEPAARINHEPEGAPQGNHDAQLSTEPGTSSVRPYLMVTDNATPVILSETSASDAHASVSKKDANLIAMPDVVDDFLCSTTDAGATFKPQMKKTHKSKKPGAKTMVSGSGALAIETDVSIASCDLLSMKRNDVLAKGSPGNSFLINESSEMDLIDHYMGEAAQPATAMFQPRTLVESMHNVEPPKVIADTAGEPSCLLEQNFHQEPLELDEHPPADTGSSRLAPDQMVCVAIASQHELISSDALASKEAGVVAFDDFMGSSSTNASSIFKPQPKKQLRSKKKDSRSNAPLGSSELAVESAIIMASGESAVTNGTSQPSKDEHSEVPNKEGKDILVTSFSEDGSPVNESSEGNQNDRTSHSINGDIEWQTWDVVRSAECVDDISLLEDSNDDKRVGKLKPKIAKKAGKRKSVTFVFPDVPEVAAGTEPCANMPNSIGVDHSSVYECPMTINTPHDALLDCRMSANTLYNSWEEPSIAIGDFGGHGIPFCNELFPSTRQSVDSTDGISNGTHSNNFGELTEGRNADATGGSILRKPLRELRKRKNRTSDSTDEAIHDESTVPELNESNGVNDAEYTGEDVQKRAHKERREQKTESKESSQKGRKASKKSTSEEPKKLSHTLRRCRRRVDKALLEKPDEEIERRQISIMNLIRLGEARERIWSKAEANGTSSDYIRRKSLNDVADLWNDEENDSEDETVPDTSRKVNYHSYMVKKSSGRWSKSETELFYQAIRQFGTDFAMIQQLFPHRTRHNVKLKFKNEERKHPMEVNDALIHRSKDLVHFEQVIQKLRSESASNAAAATPTDNDEVLDFEDNGTEENGAMPDNFAKAYDDQGSSDANFTKDDFQGNCDNDLFDPEQSPIISSPGAKYEQDDAEKDESDFLW